MLPVTPWGSWQTAVKYEYNHIESLPALQATLIKVPPEQTSTPQIAYLSVVALAVLLSLLLRRLRQTRGTVQERCEDRGLRDRDTGMDEARADLGDIHDTQLELVKLKTLGPMPSYTERSKKEGWRHV